jgi:predicted  nucleic acid-binding Zn-ribbon protein
MRSGAMAKPKGKAPPFLFQATGRIVKLLRPDIEAVKAEVSNINTEIRAINERIKAINEDLDKIEARTSKLREESGQTGSP